MSMKMVKAGDKFKPSAEAWNGFIGAAIFVQEQKNNMLTRPFSYDTKPGVVLVNNATGSDLEQFAIVSLGTPFYSPSTNENKFRNEMPVFAVAAPSEANKSKPFAIIQTPLPDGQTGLATVSGIIPAKITVSDASHGYAELAATGLVSASSGLVRILWKADGTGEQWAIVQLGAASAGDETKHIYLGTITSVGGGGSYTVSVTKDTETITVAATLLGWNDDYADLVVGQSVYVVFTKGETLTVQIEV